MRRVRVTGKKNKCEDDVSSDDLLSVRDEKGTSCRCQMGETHETGELSFKGGWARPLNFATLLVKQSHKEKDQPGSEGLSFVVGE